MFNMVKIDSNRYILDEKFREVSCISGTQILKNNPDISKNANWWDGEDQFYCFAVVDMGIQNGNSQYREIFCASFPDENEGQLYIAQLADQISGDDFE